MTRDRGGSAPLVRAEGSSRTSEASIGGTSKAMRNVANVPAMARLSLLLRVAGLIPWSAGGSSATSNERTARGYRTRIVYVGLEDDPADTRYASACWTFASVPVRFEVE